MEMKVTVPSDGAYMVNGECRIMKAGDSVDIPCSHCDGEPQWIGPGWIDLPSNGGIKPCPICNPSGAIPRPSS